MKLSGKDKSTGKSDEVFGIDVDVDAQELRKALSPAELPGDAAKDYCEAMLDPLTLPGKLDVSTEVEDTAASIQQTLSALVSMQDQDLMEREVKRDLKWAKGSQNSIRSVKNPEDLQDFLNNVLAVQDTAMKTVMTNVKMVLAKQPWPAMSIESWSFGGHITVLSRRSLGLYVGWLQHLRQVSVDVSWSLAKKELKYVDKKIALIRANSPTRLSAMLRIYIFFRDNHKADWRFPKLEAEKIVDLCKKVEAWTGSDQEETKEAETNPNLSHREGIKLCRKCQTILHGNAGCPWSALSSTKAKKAARDFMKKMAKDTTEE